MIKICKYFRGKKCTNNNKCPQQLPSNPTICTSNLYYALELVQECEGLREQFAEVSKTLNNYRKALEAIEEFCLTYSDNHDAYETVYRYILNIISKAKGEE